MTATQKGAVTYDPFDQEFGQNPHPLYRRLRDEAPLYHNEEFGFYALSRFDDVSTAFIDKETFISGRGTTIELIKSGAKLPPGTVLFEDDPTHTIHRKLLSRMFTPRRIAELEERTRRFCVELMDPLVGRREFDFVAEVGVKVPTRVISMLIGIPQEDEVSVRDQFGEKRDQRAAGWDDLLGGEIFGDYIDWRVEHPSDDIMTQLLYAEFEDETGTVRRLTREELLAYVNIVAMAGNETTRLILSWAIKLLAEHPDQRRVLVEDPSWVGNAVEECLRCEPPSLAVGRYVARDVEFHGQTVPAGAVMSLLVASANRDERHIDDPDRFDVKRDIDAHRTFGFGPHFCLGHALARLETRLVIEEMLKRFPDWHVEMEGAQFRQSGAEIRGWEVLPVVVP